MQDDLDRYHHIRPDRVVVTGWPQTDVFHHRRPRDEYAALLSAAGLDPDLPVVLVAGNTPTNAPYEARFVERLVAWWQEAARGRFSLLFRPHPRDARWEERFAAARDVPGAHVQPASFTDMEVLATLLQHVGCVVTNAGTILLDALVNDRPSVCVVYDEGAPPGESWAEKNVLGQHYRELVSSGAFEVASGFEDVTRGIERCLAAPDELADERRRVSLEVVGVVDGHAADRVVGAIAEVAGR
jgi:CDP-glycerol glycerophosphotransferase (TagB/SpsB family)